MTPGFVFRHAALNLGRGGQRSLLAVICVATGVASLVSLQLLSAMIGTSIGVDSRSVLGGDASLSPRGGRFDHESRDALNRLEADGTIAAVSLTAERPPAVLTRNGGGRATFLNRLIGVDPTTYPLVGEIVLRDFDGARPAALLESPGCAIVSRDVADRLGLATGDEVTVGGGPDGPPAVLRIAAVADMTPDRQGGTLYVSLDTAARLAGTEDAATSAAVLWAKGPPPPERLAEGGWDVTTPAAIDEERRDVVKLFGTMLKGAGMLGLLLAGIGVTNTMNVLLARRRSEIATFKAIGYERWHLLVLFGLEAGLLGLAGGVAGAVVGIGLSLWLRELLGRTGPILLELSVSPAIVAGGVLVGIATAVIFGLHAIVRASSVRPSTLFRDLPTQTRWFETLALAAALGVTFSGLAAVVLGSLLLGAGVVAIGFAGLGLLVGVLGAVFLGVLAIPVPLPGLLAMAHANMRRAPGRALVALVALFCGVFTIGFAAGTLQNAADRFASRALPDDGVNLVAYASSAHAPAVAASMNASNAMEIERMATTGVSLDDAGRRVDGIRTLTGVEVTLPSAVRITEGEWSPGANRALVPDRHRREPFNVKLGEAIAVKGASGHSEAFVVSGFYSTKPSSPVEPRTSGLIVDLASVERIAGTGIQHVFAARVPVDDLDRAVIDVSASAPGALVLSRRDFNNMLIGALRSLFGFVVGVAGFALAAGAVLIANAAGLVMVERRREIGVLKAIGFSTRRVLATVGVEFVTLGLVAGAMGIAAVAGSFAILNHFEPDARLSLGPGMSLAMVGISAVIALVSALAASWSPARCRPLDVLRQE